MFLMGPVVAFADIVIGTGEAALPTPVVMREVEI